MNEKLFFHDTLPTSLHVSGIWTMFEQYTERGRRVIFFARYEASQYGCAHIEPEHILLGILRADKDLEHRFFKSTGHDLIRRQIDQRLAQGPKFATSIDLPLSDESKRVLAYAVEEAERLSHRNIGPEHLLLGLLREEKSFTASILRDNGLRLDIARETIASPEFASRDSKPSSRHGLCLVSITSTPDGAEIEVDGSFLGHTPSEVPLLAGERTVRITKQSFQPWERKLMVLSGGKQKIVVELLKTD